MTGLKKNRFPLSGYLMVVLTTMLVYLLDHPIGALPALGRLLDPVNGCWANAEGVNNDPSGIYKFSGVQHSATVWFDSRMVPHIHADNEHDLYFLEGYIHASFRLWQMDMETRAAAGRVSEVVGEKAFNFDRKQRRKGMMYGAENSLKAMEGDERTKGMMDAYTEGINNYISSLTYRNFPLEYKLMGFAPEKWTNLKIALLLKYMADDLTGKVDDIALTYLRDRLPKGELDMLFPQWVAGNKPVIPEGTPFDRPSLKVPKAPPDSLAFPHFTVASPGAQREDGKGSNNWVMGPAKTASGAPILCNDPHLGLNLPSLWFEAQLQAPGINVYGASLPGTPGVVLGFNDSVSWGFTNNYRDVKDYYLIKPVAGSNDKYWFAGKQTEYRKRVEIIKIKGKPDVADTVKYTVHGPVMYDEHYAEASMLKKLLAICWMGHRGTNELLAIYLMNKATNYEKFVDAILNFQCPAQNIAYADKKGNIAIWGQGQFVNKWVGQGRFVMDGSDSATLWGDLIPMRENPHVLNPQQGYVASANQCVTDSTYPYWYNGGFVALRAMRINEVLAGKQKATVKDMFALQNDVYSYLAANTLPQMLACVDDTTGKYWQMMKKWDHQLTVHSTEAIFFQTWWSYLYSDLWKKRLGDVPDQMYPLQEVTMNMLKRDELASKPAMDSAYGWIAARRNAIIESYGQAKDSMLRLANGKEWYEVKNTSVTHLAKLPAFSYNHLKIGGWGNTVDAAKSDHGPSWRMVVQMTKETEAYCVYPGGQSGNPGSKYYADFLQYWVEGKYYKLLFLSNSNKQDSKELKYVWKIN